MKKTRIAGLVVFVLLLAGMAHAGVSTIENTVDSNDYVNWTDGPWFIPDDVTLDHTPYYRNMDEDWGWTHSVADQVPSDAIGIQSATLEIYAWDVDANDTEGAEIDKIYANDVELGTLEDTDGREWKSNYFDLPTDVLSELWTDGEVYIYMDIDTIRDAVGHRVTLKYATLTVEYLVSGTGGTSTTKHSSVYYFWSVSLDTYFYTANEKEKEAVVAKYPDVWSYEGVAYNAMLDDETEPNTVPVYRFWSPSLLQHLYTIDEDEKDELVKEYSDVWSYEGIAWYVFPEGEQPDDAVAVYRVGSEDFVHHYYTIGEDEKDELLKEYSDIWTYSEIAWYAYDE